MRRCNGHNQISTRFGRSSTPLLLFLLCIGIVSCSGIYAPRPLVTKFQPNITDPSLGEEVYFYTEGTLIDNLERNRDDYSGQLIFSGSGVSGSSIAVSGDFSVVAPISFTEQGEVVVSATLRAADGREYVSSAVVIVGGPSPNEGSSVNPLRLDPTLGFRATKVGASMGADAESYYRFTASAPTMVIDLVPPAADLDLRLFTRPNFSEPFDSIVGSGTPTDWWLSGLTVGNIYYLRVTNSSGPDSTFHIRLRTQ